MSTFRPTEQNDGWMLMLEEDLAGIRERLAELSLGAERDRREASALQDRVRETEALALRAISQSSAMSVRPRRNSDHARAARPLPVGPR